MVVANQQQIAGILQQQHCITPALSHGFLQLVECSGFKVHLGRQKDYIRLISHCVKERIKAKILNHNLHSLCYYHNDDSFRNIYDKSIAMIDGASVLNILRAHGLDVTFENRMAWIDLLGRCCGSAAKNKSGYSGWVILRK